ILSVKDQDFKHAINLLEQLDVPYLHLDVMDGIFVPNITYDAKKVKAIKEMTSLKLDTHLMVKNPEDVIDSYTEAGSDIITVHIEATSKLDEIITKLKKANIKCGISLKPNTPVDLILPYIDKIDLVLVMSVEPGFGGQKFIESTIDKVKALSDIRKSTHSFIIEVDGGINVDNAVKLKEVGADLIVVGTYLMNSNDIAATYRKLLQI
ncbi:MAG: ribulose-phosphate 3-epimerase, partial [Bacilli bacterium]